MTVACKALSICRLPSLIWEFGFPCHSFNRRVSYVVAAAMVVSLYVWDTVTADESHDGGPVSPNQDSGARGIFHQLRLMAGGVAEIPKLFLNAKPLPHPPGRGTYLVEKPPPAEVLLHPGAEDLLGSPPTRRQSDLSGCGSQIRKKVSR